MRLSLLVPFALVAGLTSASANSVQQTLCNECPVLCGASVNGVSLSTTRGNGYAVPADSLDSHSLRRITALCVSNGTSWVREISRASHLNLPRSPVIDCHYNL